MELRYRVAVGVLACVTALPAVAQQAQRIGGDVVSVADSTLTVRTPAGTSTFKLAPALRVTLRMPTDWSVVGPGTYVATTAVPQPDGTLLAKEIRMFEESERGVGEGHRPMSTPGDTMTNATVSRVSRGATAPRDTMTNATVAASAQAGGGHRLTLTYKGGEQTVVVPDNVPLVRSRPADRSLLTPGAHVMVYARTADDGGLVADRISVGQDGFVPPV
jgi:hypothetical protein